MKKLLLFLFLFLFVSHSAWSDSIDTLVFCNSYNSSFCFQTPTNVVKSRVVSNKRRGTINTEILWPSDKPESWKEKIQTCIDLAASTWESYLYGDSVFLKVQFSDSQNEDVITSVSYSNYELDETSYPTALYRKMRNLPRNTGMFDAAVIINSSVEWGIGVGSHNGGRNLTLAFMRSIGQALGFGSSIKLDSRNRIVCELPYYTAFDKMVFNGNGVFMSDLGKRSPALTNFCQPANTSVYVYSSDAAHKLYSPSSFVNGVSLRYLDNSTSLMSYQLPDSMALEVDNVTREVLELIGWGLETPPTVSIVGENIDSTGIASAYTSHRFYITPSGLALSNQSWTCEMPLANGGTQIIATSSGAELTVPALTDETSYYHTPDGEIKARINYSAILEGAPITATYNLTLQLKPHISYISDVVFTENVSVEDYYDLDLDARYEGCYYLYVTVKPQYSQAITPYYFDTPYFAHLHLTDVDFWGSVKVTLKAVNAFGSHTRVLNLVTPEASSSRTKFTSSLKEHITDAGANVFVFDLRGRLVGTLPSQDLVETLRLHQGSLYLMKVANEHGQYDTIKYISK